MALWSDFARRSLLPPRRGADDLSDELHVMGMRPGRIIATIPVHVRRAAPAHERAHARVSANQGTLSGPGSMSIGIRARECSRLTSRAIATKGRGNCSRCQAAAFTGADEARLTSSRSRQRSLICRNSGVSALVRRRGRGRWTGMVAMIRPGRVPITCNSSER